MDMLGVPALRKLTDRENGKTGFGVSPSGRILEAIRHGHEPDTLPHDRFGDHEPEARREFVAEAGNTRAQV